MVRSGAVAILVPVAGAQSSPDFDLHWNVIAPGGGHSAGGEFQLHGSIAQPAVGTMSGGPSAVRGGCWIAPLAPGPLPGNPVVYLPLMVRNAP